MVTFDNRRFIPVFCAGLWFSDIEKIDDRTEWDAEYREAFELAIVRHGYELHPTPIAL